MFYLTLFRSDTVKRVWVVPPYRRAHSPYPHVLHCTLLYIFPSEFLSNKIFEYLSQNLISLKTRALQYRFGVEIIHRCLYGDIGHFQCPPPVRWCLNMQGMAWQGLVCETIPPPSWEQNHGTTSHLSN